MNWVSDTIVKFLTRNPKPTLEEEIAEECVLLEREILTKRLEAIDAHYKIEAYEAKMSFMVDWISSRRAKDVKKG